MVGMSATPLTETLTVLAPNDISSATAPVERLTTSLIIPSTEKVKSALLCNGGSTSTWSRYCSGTS